ncbi:MAG: amidohydrolase [Woeseia sp.]|jgi:predicted amidohydrolase YtcJ|nr:amidohydrolase [Woeseia sp.]MBT6210007.1 amidohydrolase [Woeseia sp.]
MKRKSFLVQSLLLVCSYLVACSESPAPGVDRVFVGGTIYTLNESQPWVEALAVDGDEIVYVGDVEGALALSGSKTVQHDLDGKMLLPGFIDTHMHPIGGGAYAKALSLETAGSVEEWIADIEAYANQNTDTPLIFGYGWLSTTFGPEGPQRQMIDSVVGDRPVLIMDEGFHGAWANSRALEELNITQDTADPTPGFSYYKRDENGDATGYLLEGTAGMAMGALNVITEDVVVEGTAFVIDTLNAYGVTSAFDAGAFEYGDSLNRILNRLEDAGDLTIRLQGAYAVDGPDDVSAAVQNAVRWRDTIKGNNYHYRFLKIMQDGTVEGRTAAMFEDYQGEPGNSGESVYTEAQMSEMVVGAAAIGMDVHIHGLGERAVHEALNAIEVARDAHPGSSTRYAICHIQVITDQDLPRFAALDVIAQSTPLWASYDTYGKQFVSDDQFNRFWRFNSLKELGVRLTWGSDFPASGAGMLGMSPIYQMEIGHTRQNSGEPDAPVQPRVLERLDIDPLIRGYTLDAAYQLHMEDEIGSLEVGKKADLVVLDRNLFDIDAYEIHKASVLMTIMDGNVVYTAD